MSVNHEMENSMAGIIFALIQVIQMALTLFVYILIASAIFSWLYAFNVINSRNQFVNAIGSFLYNVTEPVLRPIRRMMPNLGGIDISPIILILIIYFLQMIIANPIAPALIALVS
ncbi:YggT family protein [Neorhizobium sp. NPDC001467]|uniref:YggT family protein n=1 Tax=Neorhizobium sp. NPDC001467 TaxID=3390595 RepID=UPI003D01B0DB